AGANLALADVVEQPKVGRRNLIFAGMRNIGVLAVRSLDVYGVARGVNGLNVGGALDRELQIDLVDRLRRVLGRAQREHEIGQAVVFAAQPRIAERNFTLWPRR